MKLETHCLLTTDIDNDNVDDDDDNEECHLASEVTASVTECS